MAKTANAYTADTGEVTITLSAANIAAIAAFTTAEEIVIDGAVISFRRTNSPERGIGQTRVTGSTTPITTISDTVPPETWELVLVDDYYEAISGGEWGTDTLAAVEIFQELFDARQDPTTIQCTPAGGSTADVETTLVNPRVVAVGHPEIVAESTTPATVSVTLSASSSTRASHA